ncbi:MAG TPA: ketopantoate reductase family protein [Thermoanaerobaculia bacterium]
MAVLGAGGIGGYFGACLARAGNEVRLLARGAHLEAIRSRGLEVRDPGESWKAPVGATDDVGELLPAELAIVAVKSYSLDAIAPAARRLAESGAVVLPLLNGVEVFESLSDKGVPRASLIAGLAAISAEKTAPGVITRKTEFRIVAVGERDGGASPRAERIASAFRDGGVDARVSENIELDLWRKFLFIASMAAACGLARAPLGAVRQAPLGDRLLERAVREIGAVARARGVPLASDEEDRVLERMAAMPPEMKPSFLLDLERGGETELDVLSGAVARYGAASGIPTPVHDTAVAALSAAPRPPASETV